MKIGAAGGGAIKLRCIGQPIGSEAEVRNELAPLLALQAPSSPLAVTTMSFLKAVEYFSGGLGYESVYFKAKSDYVLAPLSSAAIGVMMAAVASVPIGAIALLCDAYGGRIADPAPTDTAFPRRAGTQYCIQYFSSWQHANETPGHLQNLAKVYAAMQPYMFSAAYVNYCDSDLPNWASAYWGENLPRLSAIKQTYDGANVFHHQQSVPLPP